MRWSEIPSIDRVIKDPVGRFGRIYLHARSSHGNGPCHLMADVNGCRTTLCGVTRLSVMDWCWLCRICGVCAKRLSVLERRSLRHVDAVAGVYQAATEAGTSPIRELMERLSISRPTAYKLIAEARAAGAILPEIQRIQVRDQVVVAVAETLGVEYVALVAAVREHARGTLHVGAKIAVVHGD